MSLSLADVNNRLRTLSPRVFDDVLRHVVTLQQIIQIGVKLPFVDSGTAEIAEDDEPLLGERDERHAGRSVDAYNSNIHSWLQSELRRQDLKFC